MTFEEILKRYNSIEGCEQKSWKAEYLEKLGKNIASGTYLFQLKDDFHIKKCYEALCFHTSIYLRVHHPINIMFFNV